VKSRRSVAAFAHGGGSVPLRMSRIHPECPDSNPSRHSVAAEVRVREAPDEDEEEDENDHKEKEDDDDDDTDDAYSE
jgi:hypothetical protein